MQQACYLTFLSQKEITFGAQGLTKVKISPLTNKFRFKQTFSQFRHNTTLEQFRLLFYINTIELKNQDKIKELFQNTLAVNKLIN